MEMEGAVGKMTGKEDNDVELGILPDQTQSCQGVYVNSLTCREMDSLVALCDTFLAAVEAPDDGDVSDDVKAFHGCSASMAGTPDKVGGLLCERLNHPKRWLLRVALWMLSVSIGTLVLCGAASLSSRYPFCRRFSGIPVNEREKIIRSWSQSRWRLFKMMFKTFKLLILLVFFSQVDDDNQNLAWKAIGYPGPDPQFNQKKLRVSDHDPDTDETMGPLCKGILNLNLPRDAVIQALQSSGFSAKKDSDGSLVLKCDAVVVGSGSGGGVVAGVLAKAGYNVLVVEKGRYLARSNLNLLEGSAMDQMYLSGGLLATNNLEFVVLAGSTVGGGSAVNWSASIRTPKHVMKEWSESYQLELFESKLYAEALDTVCARMEVQSEIDDEGFNNVVLRKGCEEMGYPVVDIPRNSSSDHYCGWCCLGCKDGKKKSTAETWLVDMVSSGHGLVLPGCEAVRILDRQVKGSRRRVARGVVVEFNGGERRKRVVVEAEVTVVAGGALCTPSLLKKSGLKNRNIGKNLHLHPVAMGWGWFPEAPQPEKKSFEGGIMTAMSTVVANFEKSGYGALIQTPALHPGMFSAVIPWISGKDIKNRMRKYSRTAHVFALARDRGRGRVKDPNNISYKMEEEDEESLKKGLEKVLRILSAAGAEEIGTHHMLGRCLNVRKSSSHEFENFVREESERGMRDLSTQLFSAHQMGSCRMGIDGEDSVVNQIGETWEVDGLFLADASVFPTALGVNPMVTVQAIAFCTAQAILDRLRRKKCSFNNVN